MNTMPSEELELGSLYDPGAVTVQRLLQAGAESLSRIGIEGGHLDAELLLGQALGCTRERIYLDYEVAPDAAAKDRYYSLFQRRAQREPLSYITGEREFWSLDFYVTPEVLVPRPETELLVEAALGLVRELDRKCATKILDLGTGSGAIAVSLAKELGEAEIWATDLSWGALEVARRNALRHGVEGKIRLLHGDAFAPVKGQHGFFDLLVSNPPYVRQSEIEKLPPEVRDWEPKLALDGGVDGLDFYRRIVKEAHHYMADGGSLAVEIGADMGRAVCGLIADVGYYSAASVWQDYAGKDRVVAARKLPGADKEIDCEAARGG